MKKNVTDILDIHTHKQEVDTQGKSIINYPLLADSPLYMPLAENVEVAVGRGSYYSIGIHPWEVRESNVSQQLSFLQQQLQRKQFVAVGEAGLDKLAKAPMELQLAVFKEQVKLSEKLGLPLIIHCREAFPELFEVLSPYKNTNLSGIFHSFTGNAEEAEQLSDYPAFRIGINGVVTFKKSTLPETLKNVPLSKIVLETDSPYLAPVPNRGKRNETSYIKEVALKLAEIYGMSLAEIDAITTDNALKVFKMAK